MPLSVGPVHADSVQGGLIVLDSPDHVALILAEDRVVVRDRVLHTSTIILRYGFAHLHGPEFILPQLVFDDFQREHHGTDAVHFMLRSGDRFPRADVIGVNAQTGDKLELYLKQLDLAQPLGVFAFTGMEARAPVARIKLAIKITEEEAASDMLSEQFDPFPALLRQAVPCNVVSSAQITTVEKWIEAIVT